MGSQPRLTLYDVHLWLDDAAHGSGQKLWWSNSRPVDSWNGGKCLLSFGDLLPNHVRS